MLNNALALSEWFVEIFPKVLFTLYHVEYHTSTGRLEWKFERPKDDQNDCAIALLFGVGSDFFQRVVVPRLANTPEVTWYSAGKDRVVVTFEPEEPRHYAAMLGYSRGFRDQWQNNRDCWLVRMAHESAPIQE
jgi:hypothetical protein